MTKETRLNIRITPEFKSELDAAADYHGLTVSSYVHSILIKKLREERESNPEAFELVPRATRAGQVMVRRPEREALNFTDGDPKDTPADKKMREQMFTELDEAMAKDSAQRKKN